VRFLFLLLLAVNLGLYALGQGLFGTPPADSGRDAQVLPERNAQALQLEPASLDVPAAR